uniref:Nucleic-acid-binding protein n=1 Tax=Sipha flava TaxID=143950 RepID=A0A2S2QEQ2_9HEMI
MDISEALGDLGFCVRRVENVLKNGLPLPLFFVGLTPNDNNHEIFKLSSLLNTIIKFEKPNKTKNGPPQCHTCQNYGHTNNYCGHSPRCVKCGENHGSEDCTKDKNSPPKCAHCQGTHTANFKGCPVFKSLSKRPKVNRKTSIIAPASTVPG